MQTRSAKIIRAMFGKHTNEVEMAFWAEGCCALKGDTPSYERPPAPKIGSASPVVPNDPMKT